MLVHIGQEDVAERVHNAWLKTLEDGDHTYDIFTEGVSREKVGTKEFARAVVARIGQRTEKLKPSRQPRNQHQRRTLSPFPIPNGIVLEMSAT